MESNQCLELYYDHYKETSQLNRNAQRRRDKEFIIVCILEAISFFMIGDKELVQEIFRAIAEKELAMTINFSANILQSLIWMLITYFWVRYIQDILYIERQYNYLNRLENKINNLTDGQMFNREGKHYLYKYPIVLNFSTLQLLRRLGS